MKQYLIIVLLFALFAGCKENKPTAVQSSISIQGGIKLLDEVGNEQTDMRGVKLTIIESQQEQTTDSLGKFYFPQVLLNGEINVKCEYKDYPPQFLQRINLNNSINSVCNLYWNREEYNTISPIAKTEYVIDSIENSTRTNGNYFVHFNAKYHKQFTKLTYLVLLNKNYDDLNYSSGKYFYYSTDWNRSVYQDGSNDTLKILSFSYDKTLLQQIGFQTGDSIYFRIFPLTTVDFYFEKEWNGKRVFPSLGKGSNIIGYKIK